MPKGIKTSTDRPKGVGIQINSLKNFLNKLKLPSSNNLESLITEYETLKNQLKSNRYARKAKQQTEEEAVISEIEKHFENFKKSPEQPTTPANNESLENKLTSIKAEIDTMVVDTNFSLEDIQKFFTICSEFKNLNIDSEVSKKTTEHIKYYILYIQRSILVQIQKQVYKLKNTQALNADFDEIIGILRNPYWIKNKIFNHYLKSISTDLISKADTIENLEKIKPFLDSELNQVYELKKNELSDKKEEFQSPEEESQPIVGNSKINTNQNSEFRTRWANFIKKPENTIFQKNALESIDTIDQKIRNISDEQLSQKAQNIKDAMEAAITALSQRILNDTPDEKKALLEAAKQDFDNEPSVQNLQNFIAVCQAHRTRVGFNFFGMSTETASLKAFKKALGPLAENIFPPPTSWFGFSKK